MNLENIHKAHFIGIGGVGMSAMAKYLLHKGIAVSGSDRNSSYITDDLVDNYDVDFWEGVAEERISKDTDIVIYSPAVPEHDPEYMRGTELGIPLLSYPEMLGKVSSDKTTIAISGTNGKTTTTSMIIEVMKHLGEDPTGIVGALLQKWNSNFIPGNSEYFVTEACEYKESFLNIHHDVLVVTNVTEDHLDYFKDIEHIKETFIKFVDNTKGSGTLVCDSSLTNLKEIIEKAESLGMNIIDYGKYIHEGIELSIPGNHNVQNAAATLGVIEALNLNIESAKDYLKKHFQGAKRRMEHVGMTKNGIQLFDDYAHNPEGLEYLISGLRDYYPEKKIIMLFEPHLYSRTRDFKEAFGKALEVVDILYLFPTYRAREPEIPQENFLLEQYINTSNVELISVPEPKNFVRLFESMHYSNDYLVISAGAGDIWKYSHALKEI
ncbi:MAG: UDP-N-acetylmuramate--L-alanine ligase [Candidatus Pacebacteria bacterium]|nr:UDP-N-acetylmuramate--L-alanine ligase [Candidatus Paceibacterota bacterium]